MALTVFIFPSLSALFLRSKNSFLFPFFIVKICKKFSYENLEVYKKAYQTNQNIYRFLKGNKNLPAYVRDQLGRASLSIMLNIAEGSAKIQ